MLSTMRKNKDGGVTLYIQKDAPAGDLKANWLPAPNDTISLPCAWPRSPPRFHETEPGILAERADSLFRLPLLDNAALYPEVA